MDSIHHVAVQVKHIAASVQWYQTKLRCTVSYQDETWALLKLSNMSLALVLASQHPPHIAIPCDAPEQYGTPKQHRDGSVSVYVNDPDGNAIEFIRF